MTYRILSGRCVPRLFADDTCLLLADTNLNSLYENMKNEISNLCHWCKANKLSVNPVKSNAMIISPKQCSTYSATPLLYDEVSIKIVDEFKYLGVILDSKFDFYALIQLIENKISRAVGTISKPKHIFPADALLKLYYSLLHPYLLYGPFIWGSTYITYLARLGALQNRAVKLIGDGNLRGSPNLIYSKLNILKLPDLFKHETAKLVYRYFHNDLPIPLTELFVKNTNVTNRITRFTNDREITLYIPSYTSSKMQRCVKYQGVKIWNCIPHEIKSSSFKAFKTKYKQHLARSCR